MKYTILAVDDEPANLRMLERLLRKNYNVLTAMSGEEALSILSRENVSLIITDQRMPGMSGTELLRESLQTNPDTMKIILTGYTDLDALTEAINTTRVYKFVNKPWEPFALKQTIDDAIREYELSVQHKHLVDRLVALVRSYPSVFGQMGKIKSLDEDIAEGRDFFSEPCEQTESLC